MITKVILHRFKQFRDQTFELHPNDMTLFVGGNNSGKSTLLEALSIWEYSKNILIYVKGETSVFDRGRCDGYGVTLDEFTPVNIPSFKYLWTNLKFQGSYTLSIECHWDLPDGSQRHLKIGLSLTQERLFIKKLDSNVTSIKELPRIAYLPTFAGISNKEQWHSEAQRSSLIGKGLAGSVLRNQLLDLYRRYWFFYHERRGTKKRISDRDLRDLRENEPYSILNRIIYEVFKGQIIIEPFNEHIHAYIHVNFIRGTLSHHGKFRYSPDDVVHDIMVEGRGFLQWLSVYTFAVSPDVDVLLLDEPDAHLHSSLQGEMLRKLDELQQKTGRQILVATHSSEVIKSFEPNKIYALRKSDSGYLSSEDDKVAILSGIGTDYFPMMDAINSNRKILFVENNSDAKTLKKFCEKYDSWPTDVVVWPTTSKHKERKQIFIALERQLHDNLQAISLSDRDNGNYENVSELLEDKGMKKEWHNGANMLRYRTWRRWELESYLIVPSAIARVIQRKNPHKTIDECRNELNEFLRERLSIVIQDAYVLQSDRVLQNRPLFDMDAKAILEPICNNFHFDKYDILDEIRPDEICEDIKNLIAEIKSI